MENYEFFTNYEREFIGKACITMSQLSSFYGKFTAPILNVKEFRVIGEITTRYLVIFPFKHDNNTLENGISRYHTS